MQSSLSSKLHVGIIMDGNGRWAIARGLTRSQGHHAGVETVRRVAEAAPDHGIGTLTLYAFSCDNWRRPPAEVATLMGLLRLYLRTETARLRKDGVRVTAIGRRDRLPGGLAAEIGRAEDGDRQRRRAAPPLRHRLFVARRDPEGGGRSAAARAISRAKGFRGS